MAKLPAMRRKQTGVRSRQAILELLKQQGPSTAEALAAPLGISGMAVRQHLYALRDGKLVTYQEQSGPIGRPAKIWSLTPAAGRFFPDAHARLTLCLLDATDQAFGEQGLSKVVSQCAKHQIETYRRRIPARGSLQRRLQALISIRNEEGYMAEMRRQPDGTFLLIENHCPISAAATACTKLCETELAVFQSVLGEGVGVERQEHMIAGARRCVYRIHSTSHSVPSSS